MPRMKALMNKDILAEHDILGERSLNMPPDFLAW